MLLDRAIALAEKINNYQTLKTTANVVDQVATRARQFEDVSMLIRGLSNTLSTLSDAGVPVDFEPNDSHSFADKARLLREEIKADPTKLSDPPFDLKYGFNDRLREIAASGQSVALEAWKVYVDERALFGANDVLSALAQVAQFKTSVLEIRQIRSDVAALGVALPSDPKDAIGRLDDLVARHEKAWKALDASDIPRSVVAFIRSAASGEAMLSAFTPDVQSWLEDRNLLDSFRIKLR